MDSELKPKLVELVKALLTMKDLNKHIKISYLGGGGSSYNLSDIESIENLSSFVFNTHSNIDFKTKEKPESEEPKFGWLGELKYRIETRRWFPKNEVIGWRMKYVRDDAFITAFNEWNRSHTNIIAKSKNGDSDALTAEERTEALAKYKAVNPIRWWWRFDVWKKDVNETFFETYDRKYQIEDYNREMFSIKFGSLYAELTKEEAKEITEHVQKNRLSIDAEILEKLISSLKNS